MSDPMGGSSSRQIPGMTKEAMVIAKEVREHPVVMYTKHHCPYCVRAKNELNEEGIQFVEKNLNDKAKSDPSGMESYVKGLVDLTHQKTVPQIFVCGRFMGGYTEMHARRENLAKLVSECSTDGIHVDKRTVRPKL